MRQLIKFIIIITVIFFTSGCSKKKVVEYIYSVDITEINSPTTSNLTSVLNNENRIFIGSETGELFVSNDINIEWQELNFPLAKPIVKLKLLRDSLIFAIVEGKSADSYNEAYRSCYMSSDFGNSWNLYMDATNDIDFEGLIGVRAGTGSYGSLFYTNNGGATWSDISNNVFYNQYTPPAIEHVDLVNGDIFIAGLEDCFSWSFDRGENWDGYWDRDQAYHDVNCMFVSPSGVTLLGFYDGLSMCDIHNAEYYEQGSLRPNHEKDEIYWSIYSIAVNGTRGVAVGENAILISDPDNDIREKWHYAIKNDGNSYLGVLNAVTAFNDGDDHSFISVGNEGKIIRIFL